LWRKGKTAGGMGLISVFSFSGNGIIATGGVLMSAQEGNCHSAHFLAASSRSTLRLPTFACRSFAIA
jgi:dTDP-4-amino-4,6-dideoxygalactose transaminase